MRILIVLSIILTLSACNETLIPKPTGYFRIDLPEKEYQAQDSLPFPFSFEIPQYCAVNLDRTKNDSNYLNLDFNRFSARIHLSYIPVDTNLNILLEDARTLVFKHVAKAQNIKENPIRNPVEKVYGTLYLIDGNAASGSQFYLTDSTHHFIRGALYFSVTPNADSIAPVQEFIVKDMERFIESFKWKY